MLTNADITIYHKEYDPETRLDKWTYTQHKGVNWYAKRAVSVSDKGLNSANTLTVRIPTKDEVDAAIGDIVVKGLIERDITQPKELSDCERFVVTGIKDNRRGSPSMWHWRLEGN